MPERTLYHLSRLGHRLAGGCLLSLFALLGYQGLGHSADVKPPLRPPIACPADLEQLTPLLLQYLPSYANRVSQQARRRSRSPNPAAYILVAGRPEFEPLPLNTRSYGATDSNNLRQVFITTLEREYVGDRIVDIQVFHWLFLVETHQGWQLSMMFSRIGSYPVGKVPSPIRDTSDGIVAGAVRNWLRDCQAGTLRPMNR